MGNSTKPVTEHYEKSVKNRKPPYSKLFLRAIIPFLIAVFWIIDMIDVFGSASYPFGSEFFNPLSIYQSKEVYTSYVIAAILTLLATLYVLFTQRRKLFYILLAISFLLFIYPLLTNE